MLDLNQFDAAGQANQTLMRCISSIATSALQSRRIPVSETFFLSVLSKAGTMERRLPVPVMTANRCARWPSRMGKAPAFHTSTSKQARRTSWSGRSWAYDGAGG